jgi:hypothetical protein
LVTKLFDTIQPIEITPYGFKSKAVLFDQKEIRTTFDSNLYILDDIVLYDKTTKVVKFKNYNETVNRTKGFVLFSNNIAFQTNDFLEFITAVPEFNEKKRFGVIKSIAIHVENRKPRDTSFVAFRLNL